MNPKDRISKAAVSTGLTAGNSEELLHAIAALAVNTPELAGVEKDAILKALMEREALASTALGGGVAIPHCRIPGIDSFLAGLVTTSKKIDYRAPDDQGVNIFPFLIGPLDNPGEHLRILSGMAGLFRDPGIRKAARAASGPDEIMSLLSSMSGEGMQEAVPGLQSHMKMLHVFIGSEAVFNDILQVFTSGEFAGVMIMEAHQSTEYLSRIPIFAGFWNGNQSSFNRIVVAVVKQSLLHQTIRQIEYVSGNPEDSGDVMLAVSDLHHVKGSLAFQG